MIVAVIPAMNQPGIVALIERVRPFVGQVIVVDERGAAFDTGAKAAVVGAVALYSRAGCLAGAVARGVERTSRRDTVVTLDGDGSSAPEQIPALLSVDADVVIGSRFLPGSEHGGLLPRRAASRAFSLACQLRTGAPVRDWGGGFRVYRSGTAKALFPARTRGHAFQAEVLHRALQRGMSVREVPVGRESTPSTLTIGATLEAAALLTRMRRL